MFNRTAIVELLLAHGASPTTRSSDGLTPLDLARTMGAADTAAQLERLGG